LYKKAEFVKVVVVDLKVGRGRDLELKNRSGKNTWGETKIKEGKHWAGVPKKKVFGYKGSQFDSLGKRGMPDQKCNERNSG